MAAVKLAFLSPLFSTTNLNKMDQKNTTPITL